MVAILPGIQLRNTAKIADERGSFAELLREDWKDLIGEDRISQVNLSSSYPGIIRAWHRHALGQIDYVAVLKGALKICVYDDREGSPTRGHLDEIIASSENLRIVRIPGSYWHGTMTIGNQSSLTLYFMTRLYDHGRPDEERRPWNDPTIIDSRSKLPYDWNTVPHK